VVPASHKKIAWAVFFSLGQSSLRAFQLCYCPENQATRSDQFYTHLRFPRGPLQSKAVVGRAPNFFANFFFESFNQFEPKQNEDGRRSVKQ
jgi:hypothetical protein